MNRLPKYIIKEIRALIRKAYWDRMEEIRIEVWYRGTTVHYSDE
jgi:hypothetical protein